MALVLWAAQSCSWGQPSAADAVPVAIYGAPSSPAWTAAINAAGMRQASPTELLGSATGILVFNPLRFPKMEPRLRDGLEGLLKRGGSVIFAFADANEQWNELADLMPANPWTVQRKWYQRIATGALAPADSPFAACLAQPGFLLSSPYDLHLPYSTMESGQQRYMPAMGKPLLNTDWNVLLTSDNAGQLPLLVEGRCFAGRSLVFAGSLLAPTLQQWPGYPDFLKTLLKAARPTRVSAAPAPDVKSLRVEIAPVQPKPAPLETTIRNPTAKPVEAVLACKVRNATGAVMNSFTLPVNLPAGGSRTISLPTISNLLNSNILPRESDTATDFLEVEVGLAPPSRDSIAVSVQATVDRTPPLTLRLSGQDIRSFAPTDDWPAGGVEMSGGGTNLPIDRFVYFCGQQPQVRVHLANALHNIAPLAKATDVGWPENPSIQGINDLAFSYENLRGKVMLFGYWSGRADLKEQALQLAWPGPVTIARQTLHAQSDYRKWDMSNPRAYTLAALPAAGEPAAAPLVSVSDAAYTLTQRTDTFAPAVVTGCRLTITATDPQVRNEPNAFRDVAACKGIKSNCALGEWEVMGWPSPQLPPVVSGTLRVTLTDLSSQTDTVLSEEKVTAKPLEELTADLDIPTREGFGEVRVTATFTPDGAKQPSLRADFPLLFIPPDSPHLTSRDKLGEVQWGLLCTPGFVALEPFGTGAKAYSQGWGGPEDKIWAWTHDLMEINAKRVEGAGYFYLSPVGLTHYSDPWREFPSGRYVWDWATDRLLDHFENNKQWNGKKSIHIVLSDRWNGIPINNAFAWADIVSFDSHLRRSGEPGLKGRTRPQLVQDILQNHGAAYQKFLLNRYADEMIRSQERLAQAGKELTVETHGSFPLAGGELGEKLGRVDKAVGVDLFWDLKNESLYHTLGLRFGLVAANPDLESGAYTQWGYISAALGNPTWFAVSGDAEPSRRQWYATYWTGRIASDGSFRPYSVYGFSKQGGYGVKNTPADWTAYNRVQSTMIWLRPERATGFGLVASWPQQENRMAPRAGNLGFGLYTASGAPQIDELLGELYERLEPNGVPISFVASTHTLRQWEGPQPLILPNGAEMQPWEIEQLQRLNETGAPIIAVGSSEGGALPEAAAFFGVSPNGANGSWTALEGTETIPGPDGKPFAFVKRQGRAATLFCPVPIRSLDAPQSLLLAREILRACHDPLTVSAGIAPTTFSSQGSLFLLLGSQLDMAQEVQVALKPRLLDPDLGGDGYRVIDIDRAQILESRLQGDVLSFAVACGPNDGRMIQILPLAKAQPAPAAKPEAAPVETAPSGKGRPGQSPSWWQQLYHWFMGWLAVRL